MSGIPIKPYTKNDRCASSDPSVRHQIYDEIDTKGIGNSLRELLEINFILSLAFPAVADVAVMDCQNADSLVVIQQGANMHLRGTFAAENRLERGLRVVGVMISVPELYGGDLQMVHRTAQVINAIEYGMISCEFGPCATG